MALRLYHMAEQLDRTDVDQDHLISVRNKIAVCELQRDNLATSLGELLDDIYAGRKRHQTYRQMKMYNDPNLNPVIVAAKKAG